VRRSASAALLLAVVTGCSGGEGGPRSTKVVYDDGSVIEVQHPYRARTGTFAWSESGLFTFREDGTVQQSTAVAPGFAGPDGHLDVALPVAQRQGLLTRASGGPATVLGLPCQEWISQRPLDGAPFGPPADGEQTVSCVGTDGLILRDRWTRGTAGLRVRTATEVGHGRRLLGTGLLDGKTAVPVPAELTVIEVTKPGADLTSLFTNKALPPGPPALRRDLVVASRVLDRSGGAPSVRTHSGTITWVDATHLVVLTVQQSADGRPLAAPTTGEELDLGALGRGRLLPTYNGLQVQVLTARGQLVTVRGDLPEADLLAWVRTLS
jgi:hypothetical protein